MTVRRYDTLTDPSGKKFVSDGTAKKGGSADETDHDTRCRVFPQQDFDKMVREAQAKAEADKRLPPVVRRAPPDTVAGLFVGGSSDSTPSLDAVTRAYNKEPRSFDAVSLTEEELEERDHRRREAAERRRKNILIGAAFGIVLTFITAGVIGYLLYLHPSAR